MNTDGHDVRQGPGPAWCGEQLLVVRSSLLLEKAATPENASGMRREFVDWLARDVRDGDLLDDLSLAVYEALANAAEHAYSTTARPAGPVRLAAHRAGRLLRVTVSDRGRWRTAVRQPLRGRGLQVIRMLIEQVHVVATATGSAVHLRTALPHPQPR